ncbi:hypothetical protein QJ854_gp336 [Moumouvirus goulette]|uniref:Uncharacterized protein n=1 Tax=Moumouvirus goulette TaxID=1247379 RepID=M1PN91_9VIRU|nr:hypothetical protein QJ854_gp336 [Moumouvirus goulette]AGF85446.1 hypothetical protein glt_00637 [Moumouvirus goulette]
MLNNILIKLLLILYSVYQDFRRVFFTMFRRIRLIYFVVDKKIYNISFNYYFGIGTNKYNRGTFYIKEYSMNNMNHIAYTGKLSEIQNFKIIDSISIPKRKNIIIMNENEAYALDLNILDNYKIHSDYYHESCIKNMSTILSILGITCTHINIMTMLPFNNERIPVQDVTIDDLYHLI